MFQITATQIRQVTVDFKYFSLIIIILTHFYLLELISATCKARSGKVL